MDRPTTLTLVRPLFAICVAAAVVVPFPALASCNERSDSGCCCKHSPRESAPPVGANCDHESQSAVPCASRTCPCCQQAPAQSTPPARVADRLSTDYGHVAPIAHILPASLPIGLDSFAAAEGVCTAIPHRILHCSWLI